MIEPIIVYIAVCDTCNKKWANEDHGIEAMANRDELVSVIKSEGWHMGDSELNEGVTFECYCSDCYSIDEEGVFHLEDQRPVDM